MLVEVEVGDAVHEVDMTVDTNAYADGDLLADTQEIANAFKYEAGAALVQTVTVLDKDDQGKAMYVVFLNANQSLGSENSAPNISDANAEKIICVVPVAEADYVDFGGSKIACVDVGSKEIQAAASTKSLWIALLSGGDGTYAGASIHIKVGLVQT